MYETIHKLSPEFKSIIDAVKAINLSDISDLELRAKADALKAAQHICHADVGGTSGFRSEFIIEAFALTKEAVYRSLGLKAYDEQLWAGLVLHNGGIAEMATGEGKTIAAAFPAFLNSAAGFHTDIYTFNDYLARRDTLWLKPVYNMLGITSAFLQEGQTFPERKAAYSCDVTYMTARECGFDYLREFTAESKDELFSHVFEYAIVDEADSILIDEARIPLVIAESTDALQSVDLSNIAGLAKILRNGQDYAVDDYESNVYLTEEGIEYAEEYLGIENLYSENTMDMVVALNNALYAEELLRKDVDYIVRDEKIHLVDEFTGRVAQKRHWPHGLHEAIEAKEGLKSSKKGRILSQITLQNFMRLYPRLCGMTGTAVPAAEEFDNTYNLRVHVIPTHNMMIRRDNRDLLYSSRESKTDAIVSSIRSAHAIGRPVLIGTGSVEESEELYTRLLDADIRCDVLNAKNDEMEAQLIAMAGDSYSVTVSTNMAGRGIDIKLGGKTEKNRDFVISCGGLLVIGTNRHESLRVDSQLRGRAGRQGDPGESQFIISIEDEIFNKYNFAELIPARVLSKFDHELIQDEKVLREASRLQRIVQGLHFDIRSSLSKYTVMLQEQSNYIRIMRNSILNSENTLSPYMETMHPAKFSSLCFEFGRSHVCSSEKLLCLRVINNAWAEYLDNMDYVKDSIHIMKMSGKDPLFEYNKILFDSFIELKENIVSEISTLLNSAIIDENGIDLDKLGFSKPSSTWTYIVSNTNEQLQLFPFLDALAKIAKKSFFE
ncbi:MAG: preprotein translocase subunit SecA [Saccharofermentanales bacterium]